MKPEVKKQKRIARHRRIRGKVFGTSKRPRLSIFRSNNHLHLQVIDDEAGKTLVAASTIEVDAKKNKSDQAAAAGKILGEKALKSGIKEVVFDRGGFSYHGRVKVAADAVRETGIKI